MGDPPPLSKDPALLPAREAYRLWAATYDACETAPSLLDLDAIERLTPPVAGRTLLDAACGTGRRLPGPSPTMPRLAVGVDLVPEMLLAGRRRSREARLIAADICALPLQTGAFDVGWCRLAAGSVADLSALYREMGRVLQSHAALIVTDFHPAAVAAGHRRTFRDAADVTHIVQHHGHALVDHLQAAQDAGFHLAARLDCAVGPSVRFLYAAAGALERYEQQVGLPLVLALSFER